MLEYFFYRNKRLQIGKLFHTNYKGVCDNSRYFRSVEKLVNIGHVRVQEAFY